MLRHPGHKSTFIWHEVPGNASLEKNRPVGYGMIGAANPRGVSLRKVAVFFKEVRKAKIEIIQHKFLKFRMSKFSSVQSSNHSNRFAHLHESDRTLRDGSLGRTVSQALRARLRSHRPSGTSPFGADALCASIPGTSCLANPG